MSRSLSRYFIHLGVPTILKYRLRNYIGQISYICPLISIKSLHQIKRNLTYAPIRIIIQAQNEILLLAPV